MGNVYFPALQEGMSECSNCAMVAANPSRGAFPLTWLWGLGVLGGQYLLDP